MKAQLFFLSALLLSGDMFAQVTIDRNEFYNVNDVINMVPADPTGTSAGAAGTGVTWDFSSLSPAGGVQTTYVTSNTSGTFLQANLMMTMPDGKKYYVKENNTDTYLYGITNSMPGGDTIYYNNLKMSRRPISYMTFYTDTFTVNVPSTGMHGVGYVTSTVDAAGTLMTPRGTYTDVLRVMRVQSETDTLGAVITTSTMISYLWFDSVRSAPLLRIDSTIGVVGAGNTIMYQAPSTDVAAVAAERNLYRANMHDDGLTLFGDFENGRRYHVIAYNIIGKKIIDQQFAAHSGVVRFHSNGKIVPGLYMVSITPEDDLSARQVIKVLKQ